MFKKISRVFLLAVCVIALNAAAASAMMQRVAVLPFENASPLSARQEVALREELNAAAEYVQMEMVNSGRFQALEREQIDKALDEIGMGMTGAVDPSTAPQIAKMVGAKYLFLGKITNVSVKKSSGGGGIGISLEVSKRRVNVTLAGHIVNVETGVIVKGARGVGNSSTSNTAIGHKYRDFFGFRHFNTIFHIGSTEVSQESVDNALYKAACDLVDNLVDAIDGKGRKRR